MNNLKYLSFMAELYMLCLKYGQGDVENGIIKINLDENEYINFTTPLLFKKK